MWLIGFISFGIFTMIQINSLEGVMRDIYDDPLAVASNTNEMRINLIKIDRSIKSLALLDEEVEIVKELENLSVFEEKVLENLQIIKERVVSEESKKLEVEVRKAFMQWREGYQKIGALIAIEGNYKIGQIIKNAENDSKIRFMEERLIKIHANAEKRANSLVVEASNIEKSVRHTLIIIMLTLGSLFFISFLMTIRSILSPILTLQDSMNSSTVTDTLSEVHLKGDNEITEIARYYNLLIQKLKNQFWIKDGQNLLNKEISGLSSLEELTQRSLNFIARTLEAGKAVFYLYDEKSESLYLQASFAFTERERLSHRYALGEGIIGQVAREKKPILLRNTEESPKEVIVTGVTATPPLNIYTFPLIHEERLQGVIELAFFNSFHDLKREFLEQVGGIISINLYSAMQNQKVKDLLEISERAQKEARITATQLQKTNALLEEQQTQVQQQSEELQQTNAELEEQQQLLQQQSEELQQTNVQLEEQQQLLEEQTRILNMKNQELEISKEEMWEHSKQLEKANKYKSEFLANMSHELRTPLNSIILLSKLLTQNDKKVLDKDEMEKINVIHNAGQELLRLINDILDLSKIESGNTDLNITQFYSKDLLRSLKQLFERIAEEKDIKLTVEDSLDRIIEGDHDKISQILRNLLSNALKFTHKGSVELKVKSDHNNGVIFSVSDTGIGICKENLSRIFEAFQQGDGSISRRFGGTGLGLSISKRLAELMGADLEVSSEEGKGSMFTLHLKDVVVSSNVQMALEELAYTQEEDIPRDEETDFDSNEHKVILIIEDDMNFAEYIKTLNTGLGLKTLIAKNGREGLIFAKKYSIDAILLDLGLPDINGIEVLRQLKTISKCRNIPVHIISAWSKNNTAQKMGAIGYYEKNAQEEDIAEVILKMVDFAEKEPKRLLIVEDNMFQRKAMEELIKDASIQVDTVGSEKEAKHKLDHEHYDTIILDLELGLGSGMNICRYLEERKLEIPIIIYTARELTVEQEKQIRKYADSIIVKTAHSEERLLDEVTLFLHKIKTNSSKDIYLSSKTNQEYGLRMTGKKILIVDDDPRNVFVLASALEDYGAEIIEAENGQAALEKLKQTPVDLILMDIMMPVMDGFETMKVIRKNIEWKETPIIAITAKSLKGDREKCIAAGADDYISKPVDYDVLVRLVKAWIDK